MKSRTLVCSLLLASLAAAVGCDAPLWRRLAPQPDKPTPSNDTAQGWTPERISKDPAGYLKFADAEIVRQKSEREARIEKIEASSKMIAERSEKLRQDIRDAANIQKRLQAAITRADEDETWPITFAGRKLERAKAKAIADASQRFVTSRASLASDYEQALLKIDSLEQSMRSDLVELSRLREKLALDMERVRLNQGISEVAELRKSVDALSGFATSLADTTDNPLDDLAAKARPLSAEAELESLLGK
jgi:chaperonin cofactor prefoldin